MANIAISVVIPVFNEKGNLEPLTTQTLAALDTLGDPAELIFVDDCSDDDTPATLAGMRQRDARVRTLRMEQRSGQSAALWAGFNHARGGIIATLDGDLQNDPSDLPAMVEKLTTCDLVCGWRVDRKDNALKRISSIVGNSIRRLLLGSSIQDTGCGIKVFKRQCALDMTPFNGMHRFFAEVALLNGYTIAEMPVKHHPRNSGVTKYGVGNRALRGLIDCFGVRWLRKRHAPRRAHEMVLGHGTPDESSTTRY